MTQYTTTHGRETPAWAQAECYMGTTEAFALADASRQTVTNSRARYRIDQRVASTWRIDHAKPWPFLKADASACAAE